MTSIFISYRRTDAPAHAGRIYDRLVERFGKDNVYKDLDSTAPGAEFAEVINETIAGCDALLAVIGRDWISAARRWRRGRQLNDPQDWVCREIAAALERNIRVVPVLVEGARMPSRGELPDDIEGLARRHAVELSETAWTPQLGQLIDTLAAKPPPIAPRRAAPAPLSERPPPARRERTSPRRIGVATTALIVCGLTIGIAIALVDGGHNNEGTSAKNQAIKPASAGNKETQPAARGSLSGAEYRLQMIGICGEYLREARRIGHAEGDRPVYGSTLQLEEGIVARLKTLRPPKALEPDHRSLLALWGRRLSLLGYYYPRYRERLDDPKFRREFERQLKRVDRLSRAVQKRFEALGVTPECSL